LVTAIGNPVFGLMVYLIVVYGKVEYGIMVYLEIMLYGCNSLLLINI
jgi:hypothetical protein